MAGSFDRSRLRQPGSVILQEFRLAMELQRSQGARPRLTPAHRTFAAGESNRLTAGWTTWDASINALLENTLGVLRARSRQWSRNTGAGRRFLSLVKNGVVGPNGYTLQMRCGDWRQEKGRWVFRLDKLANDAIERAWNEWCQRGNCEVTGKLSFADVCKLQMEVTARDGEYLARKLKGTKANKWRYQLQLLSSDRLDLQHNVSPRYGNEVRMGVERDDAGRAVRYTLLKYNPGDARGTREAEQVAAEDVLHDFIPIDVEQARGVPWSHAVLLGANMLASFEESAVFAARVGASNMGFFTQEKGDGTQSPVRTEDLGVTEDPATGNLITDVEPGALELLPPGVGFEAFDSKYPTEAFDPFTKSRKRDIAAGLDVANHNLTGDMNEVNYSSARIAELAERDGWRGVANWFIGSFVNPVFRDWLEFALLSGAITLPGGQTLSVTRIEKYLAGVTFRSRGWDWIDPQKEVNAARTAVEEGFTTRSQVVASKGGDFEDNVIEIAQENQILQDNGVSLGAAKPEALMTAPEPNTDTTGAAE